MTNHTTCKDVTCGLCPLCDACWCVCSCAVWEPCETACEGLQRVLPPQVDPDVVCYPIVRYTPS
jgi:hypothetical protein